MQSKQFNKFKYQALGLACVSILGITSAYSQIHTISNSNFSMLSTADTLLVGGATDVSGQFDDTMICSAETCSDIGMTLVSTAPFFGFNWTAHDVRVFAPGTYTFDTKCTATDIANGTTSCGGSAFLNMTVPEGALGAHMLFDWNTTKDIDVIVQWDLNGQFGTPIQGGVDSVWNLVSRDGVGFTQGSSGTVIQPDGIRGYSMVDGSFPQFNANFNLNMTPPFAFNVAPIAANTAASTSAGVITDWTPSVSDPDNGPSPLTCSIVSQPPVGQGAATVATDCSTGTYDPETYTGPSTSFTYRANDGDLDSNPATVTVTISDNPPPVAGNTSITATGINPATVDLAPFITDGNGDVDLTTLAISTPAANGDAVSNNNGTVTYTANAYFSGLDTFGYTVEDAAMQPSNEGSVTVSVLADGPSSSTPGYGPGLLAQSVGSTDGSGLTVADVGTDAEMQQQCVGGCIDFLVSDPSIVADTPVTVVIPLLADIPVSAIYRKDTLEGWMNFDSSGADGVFSAPAVSLSPLVCPRAGAGAYAAGLNAGHRCLQLVIVNDGPNDSEKGVPNTIADPGGIGVAVPKAAPTTSISNPSTGGCSLGSAENTFSKHNEWWLMIGFLTWLGLKRRNNREH